MFKKIILWLIGIFGSVFSLNYLYNSQPFNNIFWWAAPTLFFVFSFCVAMLFFNIVEYIEHKN
jgi:hypothetical protein